MSQLRPFTEMIGGPDDGRQLAGHCSKQESRVPTTTLVVFSVYTEIDGKLVFQGYRIADPPTQQPS